MFGGGCVIGSGFDTIFCKGFFVCDRICAFIGIFYYKVICSFEFFGEGFNDEPAAYGLSGAWQADDEPVCGGSDDKSFEAELDKGFGAGREVV